MIMLVDLIEYTDSFIIFIYANRSLDTMVTSKTAVISSFYKWSQPQILNPSAGRSFVNELNIYLIDFSTLFYSHCMTAGSWLQC